MTVTWAEKSFFLEHESYRNPRSDSYLSFLIVIPDTHLSYFEGLQCSLEIILLIGYRIIIAQNHPSGVAQPTEQDTELTKRLVLCGDILDITVLDHLIVTEDYFRSHVLPACGSPICSAFIKLGSRATS